MKLYKKFGGWVCEINVGGLNWSVYGDTRKAARDAALRMAGLKVI